MKHSLRHKCVLAASIIFVFWAKRLPAPIVEPESTPVPIDATKIAKPAPASTKAPKLRSSASDRFQGTWIYQASFPEDRTVSPRKAPNTKRVIMKITGETAVCEYTMTQTLTRDAWSDLPAPYNTVRERSDKYVTTSEKMQVTGSTLSIRLKPWKAVDWSPKMPRSTFLPTAKQPDSDRDWAFQLVGQNELKDGAVVFHRVK